MTEAIAVRESCIIEDDFEFKLWDFEWDGQQVVMDEHATNVSEDKYSASENPGMSSAYASGHNITILNVTKEDAGLYSMTVTFLATDKHSHRSEERRLYVIGELLQLFFKYICQAPWVLAIMEILFLNVT